MKIVAIFGDQANQRALAAKINAVVPLTHVARIQLKGQGRRKVVRSLTSLTVAGAFRRAWQRLQAYYDEHFPEWPQAPSSIHDSANAEDLVSLIERLKPELVLVSGTDLLKARTLKRFNAKIMNLHTGISPYIKGGPNCTNWALALGEFDLIGNTIMWIDAGIDTGAIIATERTPLTGHESIGELHLKVMEHAHDLYSRAVEAYAKGSELPCVPQGAIAEGRLFRTRDWNTAAMVRAVFNHTFQYRPFVSRPDITLVDLDRSR